MGDRMLFLISLGAALLLTPLAAALGRATGVVDRPSDELKIHEDAVPTTGGLAVLAAALGAAAIFGSLPSEVVLAAGLCFAVGLVDDLKGLPAWARVLLQGLAGVILVAGGTDMASLGPLGPVGVVLLVLALTNAVNIIDGQDALAGGLAALAAAGLALVAALGSDSAGASLGLALAGALVGFLVFNRPPARIFLGDAGAYGVGVVLAALAARPAETVGWQGILVSGICLGVFAFEIAFTVARRLWGGGRLTGGDRFHSYDLLAESHDRFRVTVVFWAAGFVCAASAAAVILAGPYVGAGLLAAALLAAAGTGARLFRRLKSPALETR